MMKNIIFLILFLFCCLQVSAQNYLQLANNCFEKGDYECAKKNYTLYQTFDGKDMSKLIQISDDCFKALLVADDYFKGKEYEKAHDRYKTILEKNPKDSHAKRRYNECERIIKPKLPEPIIYSPVSWYQEGVKNSNAGNYSEAIRCYLNALNMNPNMSDALYNLGIAYFQQENYNKAIDCFQKSINITNNGSAWYNMGLSYAQINNRSESIKCLKSAARLKHKGAQKLLEDMDIKW